MDRAIRREERARKRERYKERGKEKEGERAGEIERRERDIVEREGERVNISSH
jgi:hypothetical protein